MAVLRVEKVPSRDSDVLRILMWNVYFEQYFIARGNVEWTRLRLCTPFVGIWPGADMFNWMELMSPGEEMDCNVVLSIWQKERVVKQRCIVSLHTGDAGW